jgi:hypothetical protein
MPLRLNIGINKKVGLPEFGSVGAYCSVELELSHDTLVDPAGFQNQVRQAYAACSKAVADELARQQNLPNVDVRPGTEIRSTVVANGNGHRNSDGGHSNGSNGHPFRWAALFLVLPIHDGHNNLHQRPGPRLALDDQPTAEEPYPLPNALHTEVPGWNRLGIEPNPPVTHLQPNILTLLIHRDRHLRALAVLASIGQRLLGDAIDRVLQDRR